MKKLEQSINIFKALGDKTRLSIVYSIMDEAKSVNVIANEVEMTQSAISHQLQLLKFNGIIKSERKGKEVYYSLDDEHIKFIIAGKTNQHPNIITNVTIKR